MEERRKNKRLDLNVSLELERLDDGGITTLKYVQIDVQDLSKSGIGFRSDQELALDSFYNTKMVIWTKEVIDTVIKIIRRSGQDGHFEYGAQFVGMTDTDALKIQIYQMLDEANGN